MLNKIYKEDDHAFIKLGKEIKLIKDKVDKELVLNEEVYNNIGVKYLDGSSVIRDGRIMYYLIYLI